MTSKHYLALFLLLTSIIPSHAQLLLHPSQHRPLANPSHDNIPWLDHSNTPPESRDVPPLNDFQPNASAKATAITMIKLGSAANIFNWTRNEQHLLLCDNTSRLLTHIHRQDYTIWGGGSTSSGRLRYDVSIDGGATFSNDIGPLNPSLSISGRYPQVTQYNPTPTTNPLDVKLVWAAAGLNLPSSTYDGIVSGVSNVVTSGSPWSSETHALSGMNTMAPTSLCHGLPGEFWMADLEYLPSGTTTGKILLLKGIYNSGTGDVDWTLYDSLVPTYNLSVSPSPVFTVPNIFFSPDGMDGWVTMLGDLTGGRDSTYNPIFWHSTDGGATWGSAIEVNLDLIPWIDDTLKTLWVDSLGNPVSTGKATTAFEHDLTVDLNGNPHMGVVVGSASTTSSSVAGYTIFSGLAKFMADVYSTDGGLTWQAKYLAPTLTLRYSGGGGGGGSGVVMDNCIHAARNDDGSKVFFTWVDSDTCILGLGATDNEIPNLRGVSWRVTDGYRTMYKLFTDNDPVLGESVLFPHLAPHTLRTGSAEKLFTGSISFQVPGDELQPVDFYTYLHDTWFDDSEYLPEASFADLSWHCGMLTNAVDLSPSLTFSFEAIHPNPATELVQLKFILGFEANPEFSIHDLQGRLVHSTSLGALEDGIHHTQVELPALSPGIYLCTLSAKGQSASLKLVVTR